MQCLDTIRNHYKVGDFDVDYPAEVTEVRIHMANGITSALKGVTDKWPRWMSDVLFANDMVLIDARACGADTPDGIRYVAAPSEVHEMHWRKDRNDDYMRETVEYMLATMDATLAQAA